MSDETNSFSHLTQQRSLVTGHALILLLLGTRAHRLDALLRVRTSPTRHIREVAARAAALFRRATAPFWAAEKYAPALLFHEQPSHPLKRIRGPGCFGAHDVVVHPAIHPPCPKFRRSPLGPRYPAVWIPGAPA